MKKLIVLLAITGLVGCADDYGLDRCIEKADMKYQGCVGRDIVIGKACDYILEAEENACRRESRERGY